MRRNGAPTEARDSGEAENRTVARNVMGSAATIDLFCGAGGITEGFREAGYRCLYGNDCMPEAIETFSFNHPEAWAEARGH